MRHALHPRRGATTVEFALVGIPLLFILISIFEISRGMWMWETMAHAVREGARFAAVHGINCVTPPNNCPTSMSRIGGTIENAAVGLRRDQFMITIRIYQHADASTPVAPPYGPKTLGSMTDDPASPSFSAWTYSSGVSAPAPPNDVVVIGSIPFSSALAMFWPGGGVVQFGTVNLTAISRQRMLF